MNTPAAIHQYTWFQSTKTKKFWVVLQAGWAHDDEAKRWLPTDIVMLEHLGVEPVSITHTRLCTLIERGEMIVIATPV